MLPLCRNGEVRRSVATGRTRPPVKTGILKELGMRPTAHHEGTKDSKEHEEERKTANRGMQCGGGDVQALHSEFRQYLNERKTYALLCLSSCYFESFVPSWCAVVVVYLNR